MQSERPAALNQTAAATQRAQASNASEQKAVKRAQESDAKAKQAERRAAAEVAASKNSQEEEAREAAKFRLIVLAIVVNSS